jgi:PKD repeat protein
MSRALLVAALACSCAQQEPVAPPVDVNQEPVALLSITPATANAGDTVALDGTKSIDVDGNIASATLDFGDGSTPATFAHVDAIKTTHTWATAGLYDVTLAVTDDKGLVGRARTRISIAQPPDANPPTISSFSLSLNGAQLDDGARVDPGSSLTVDVRASDAEGNLDHVDVAMNAATATAISIPLAGADAAGTGSITVGGTGGDVVVSAVAVDLAGNRSPPSTISIHIIGATEDSDGDGIPDLSDPEPNIYNGLTADVFQLADFPQDLLGNPEADKICASLDTATPVATFATAKGYLAVDSTTNAIDTLYPDAPALSTDFAIRYTGALIVPHGADTVSVDTSADDIAVVFLNGTPVASSNSDYATDFLRLQRVPATSAPTSVTGSVPLEIVVANHDSAYSWSVRFTFSAQGATVMPPESVTQQQFEVNP